MCCVYPLIVSDLDMFYTCSACFFGVDISDNFGYLCVQGDLVDAVVPFMGESITDGTLASFLKSMFSSFQLVNPLIH